METQRPRILQAEFVTSAAGISGYPADGLPWCAMVGKSNVGKSSLINSLSNNRKLARISAQPGKTRLVNFYLMNQAFYLVDLPGYGFARVSKEEQRKWGPMMQEFFARAAPLSVIVMIVDIRHDPTAEDMQMADWIRRCNIPVILAASKADKLGKTRRKPQCARILSKLGFSSDTPIVPYSAVSGQGMEALLEVLSLQIPLQAD